MASRLWQFLTTDIRDLVSLETVDSGKDATEAVLGLAEALQSEGPDVRQLAPLVTQLDSLLDVLNSPLGNIVGASLPFVSIATGLLKFYLEKTKKEPTVAQSVALVSQAAYMATVKEFLEQPQLQSWIEKKGDRPASHLVKQKLQRLESFELDDTEARRALLYFHESKLAEVYGEVLVARLSELGVKAEQSADIADKLARKTNRLMLPTLVNCSDSVQALVEWLKIGGKREFEKYLSIDIYLEEIIKPRPAEKVFAEPFAFKDIYVPLKAQLLTGASEPTNSQKPVVLEEWARQMLNDDEQKGRVMFVQGGPGRGKSVFCRMFADWVRRHEHPRWTPILIRLRDVSVLSKDFEETLAKAVDRDFAKTDSGWLTDRNVNFLFILDGFDELLMEGRTSGGLDHFLDQVGRFQEQCARNTEKHHRVLITGRTLALQSIESRMPSNLARIEIQPMDDELQLRWFDRWGDLIGQDKSHLMAILQDERLPERVRELAREPLLLYLLAAMHRDGELRLEMFAGAEGARAKVLIYERTLEWVLTKQRPEWLNKDVTEIEISGLRRILQEAGLCVVQSGMEFASIRAIEDRLSQNSGAKEFLENARQHLDLKKDDTPLRNALAAFYLQEGRQGEGSIEFVHKSFGEFLCAERIVNGLIDVCQPGRNREYDIEDPAFCWMMYDLLGCHVLTPEIVEYLTALLTKHPEFEAEKLHKRLYDFYWRWSDGEFIDAPPENLPQRKMRFLQERVPDQKEALGQRQIDIYTGLNTMILLWVLNRYGLLFLQGLTGESVENWLLFHPCQHPYENIFHKQKLRQIFGLGHCLEIKAFSYLYGPFLSNANLAKANLRRTNFYSADLSHADMRDTILDLAYLSRANLSSANLRNSSLCGADLNLSNLVKADLGNTDFRKSNFQKANLYCAILHDANLSGADLYGANLCGSNLYRANLFGAILREADLRYSNLRSVDFRRADLSSTNLSGADLTWAVFGDDYGGLIRWDMKTNWEGVKGLEKAIGLPEVLKRQLGLIEE